MQPQRTTGAPSSVDGQELGEEQKELLQSALAECSDEEGGASGAILYRSPPCEPQASKNLQRVLQGHYHTRCQKTRKWSLEEMGLVVECAVRIQEVSTVDCLRNLLSTYGELEEWLLCATKANSTDVQEIQQLMQRVEKTVTELATSTAMQVTLTQHCTPENHRMLGSILPEYLKTLREQYQETVLSFVGRAEEEAQGKPIQPAKPSGCATLWQWFVRVIRCIMRYLCCCCRCFADQAEQAVPEDMDTENHEDLRRTFTQCQQLWQKYEPYLQHLQDTGRLTSSAAHGLCALLTCYVEGDVASRKMGIPGDLEVSALEIEEMLCSCLQAISIDVTVQNTSQYVTLLQCLQDMKEFLPLFMGLGHVQTLCMWVICFLEEQASQNLRLMCIPQSSLLTNAIGATQALIHLTTLTSGTLSAQNYQQQCRKIIDRTFSHSNDQERRKQRQKLLQNMDLLVECFGLYNVTYQSSGVVTEGQHRAMCCFQHTCCLLLEKQSDGDQDTTILSAIHTIKNPETIRQPATRASEESLMSFAGLFGTVSSHEGLLIHSVAPVTTKTMQHFGSEWNKEEFSKPSPIRVAGGYQPFLEQQAQSSGKREDPCLRDVEMIDIRNLNPALQKMLPKNAQLPLYNVFVRDCCRSSYSVNGVRITGKSLAGPQRFPEVVINIVEALICTLLEVGYSPEECVLHLYDISVACHQGMAACMQTVLCGKPLITCRDGTLLGLGNFRQKKHPGQRTQHYDISIQTGTHHVTCHYESTISTVMSYVPITGDEQHYQQNQCMYGMDDGGDIAVKDLPYVAYGVSCCVLPHGKVRVTDCKIVTGILVPGPSDACYPLGRVAKEELCLDFLS